MAEKYKVIVNKLELELKKMRSEGRTRLPSEQDLCSEFSCSRQTIRAALDVLLQKGLIVKRRGAGSYIADDSFINRTVFFMTEDCDRYQSPALISGLKEQLSNSKYELRSFSGCGSAAEESKILSCVIKEHPAALIIEPAKDLIPDPNTRLIEEIENEGIPVIYLNSSLGKIHIASDNYEGGRELTKHVLESGRKKTACIFRIDDSSGRDRYKGYIDALLDADGDYDESRCFLMTYKDEREIISGDDKKFASFIDNNLFGCDSVICQNGMVAHQLVNMLNKRGVSVPDDVYVACFDNSYYSANGTAITSLGYDDEFLCKALAKTAVSLAEGKHALNVEIPFVLNKRISTLSNQQIPV